MLRKFRCSNVRHDHDPCQLIVCIGFLYARCFPFIVVSRITATSFVGILYREAIRGKRS